MPPHRHLALVALLVVPASLPAWSPSAVAEEVSRALERLLGRAGRTHTFLYPPDPGAPEGAFPRVEVVIERGRLGAITLTEATVVLGDAVFDTRALEAGGRVKLLAGSVERLHVMIDERDLEGALGSGVLGRSVHGPRVALLPGTLILSGRVGIGFLSPSAELWGGFELADGGRQVIFVPEGMELGLMSAGREALRGLMGRLNPVVDLGDFCGRHGIEVRLRSIVIERGRLVVRG